MKTTYQIERWEYEVYYPCPGCAFENPNGLRAIEGEYDTLEKAIAKCSGAYIEMTGIKGLYHVTEYAVGRSIVDDEGDEDYEQVYEETLTEEQCERYGRKF